MVMKFVAEEYGCNLAANRVFVRLGQGNKQTSQVFVTKSVHHKRLHKYKNTKYRKLHTKLKLISRLT